VACRITETVTTMSKIKTGMLGNLEIGDLGEAVVHVVPGVAFFSSARAHQTIASQVM